MIATILTSCLLFANDPTQWDADVFHAAGAPASGAAGEAVAVHGDQALFGAPHAGAGCVYVYSRSSPGQPFVWEATLHPADGVDGQRFGAAVAVPRPGFVAVGSPRATGVAGERGAVYLYARGAGGGWNEIARYEGLGTAPGDRYGAALAAKDESSGALIGFRLLVGAPLHSTAGVAGSGAAFSISYDGVSGTSIHQKITPHDPTPGASFGASVAFDRTRPWAVIGAPRDSQAAFEAGAVYVYDVGSWLLQAKRWASDASASSLYGSSVGAAQDRIVVGAPRHDGGASDAGALYVLDRTMAGWTETSRFEGSTPAGRLGASSALVHDGSSGTWRLAAGSPGSSTAFTAGAAGGAWSPLSPQTSPDGASGNGFAASVAIAIDATLVGAPRHDSEGPDAGAVYYFDAPAPPWNFAVLRPWNAAPGERFGDAVAVDGTVAVVGATGEDDVGEDSGAAYVWDRIGTTWEPTAKLTGGDEGRPYAIFGVSVDVSGETIAVGAPLDSELASEAGAVFVFRRTGSTWVREAVERSAVAFENFGSSLALEGDLLAVGAPLSGAGAVHLLQRSGSSWSLGPTITAPDGAVGDAFGDAVELQGDTLAVGAFRDDHSGFVDAGAVYVFGRSGTSWTFQQKVVSQNVAGSEFFGSSVALDDDWLAAGASGNDSHALNAGAVYVHRLGASGFAFQSVVLPFLGTSNARFGASIDLDAQNLLVGAPLDSQLFSNTGAAYLHHWDGFLWSRVATVPALAATPLALRGTDVAVSGKTLLIGAPGTDFQFHVDGAVDHFDLPDGTLLYCQGKVNSAGCVPFMAHNGVPSASGTQPFVLTGAQVLPNEPAFLIYGFAKSNLAFHGGKLCVKLPFRRLLPPKQAPAFGAPPCTGLLERNFNNRIQSGVDPLLTAGQRVFAQWRTRDPADPAGFGDGFTDAVRFTVCP